MSCIYLFIFLICFVSVWNWFRRNRIEVAVSETKPGLHNLPVEAAAWLKLFQKQNAHLLTSPEVRFLLD